MFVLPGQISYSILLLYPWNHQGKWLLLHPISIQLFFQDRNHETILHPHSSIWQMSVVASIKIFIQLIWNIWDRDSLQTDKLCLSSTLDIHCDNVNKQFFWIHFYFSPDRLCFTWQNIDIGKSNSIFCFEDCLSPIPSQHLQQESILLPGT
jgi:hypothetical protein